MKRNERDQKIEFENVQQKKKLKQTINFDAKKNLDTLVLKNGII